jgi:hypothetical protein
MVARLQGFKASRLQGFKGFIFPIQTLYVTVGDFFEDCMKVEIFFVFRA